MSEARAFRRAGRGKSASPVRRGESGLRSSRRLLSYSTLYLAGHADAVLPGAIISALLFLTCAGLYVFVVRLDRRQQD